MFNSVRVKEIPLLEHPFLSGTGGGSLSVAPIPIVRVYLDVPIVRILIPADFSAEGVRVA